MADPEDWDEHITQVVDTHWVDAGRSILYEEVNILHPWVQDHPLHLRTNLRITETRQAEARKVAYQLHESLDDALDLDEGYLSVEARGPDMTLVTIHKRLRVLNNPVLFAMLRFNPDGLGALISFWMQEVSTRAEPRGPRT